MEVLKVILFAVNLSSLVDTTTKLENLVRAGYYFNGWVDPPGLSI